MTDIGQLILSCVFRSIGNITLRRTTCTALICLDETLYFIVLLTVETKGKFNNTTDVIRSRKLRNTDNTMTKSKMTNNYQQNITQKTPRSSNTNLVKKTGGYYYTSN